jgi:adenylate cyclase
VENPSGHSSPYLRPPSSLSISDGSSRKDSSSTAADDSRRPSLKSLANRQIDPAFVVSLGSLAVRLERLTTGSIHMPSGNDDMYNKLGFPDAIVGVGGSQKSPFANAFTKRMEEVASDEELIMLIENFVTRIEVIFIHYNYHR